MWWKITQVSLMRLYSSFGRVYELIGVSNLVLTPQEVEKKSIHTILGHT